ncbi:PREDICTED: uncharacterized protein C1orf173 homolog [Chrysochloris asiatica]|uniref:Uncharacterized protein C1orf173 homolog n=1 Tax=Chrysochloris asiatica TaxID=185453 RepID=A0A9B0WDJ6_CHRAS|nr:PREDICTED: uncharacterized protein C1orf173 homolog [Chrysochloris asiatica]
MEGRLCTLGYVVTTEKALQTVGGRRASRLQQTLESTSLAQRMSVKRVYLAARGENSHALVQQASGEPVHQSNSPGCLQVSSYIGAQKKRWKVDFHFQLTQTLFQQRLCFSLSNRRLWILSAGGGLGDGGPAQVSGAPRPQCGATPQAPLLRRQRTQGPKHPPSTPAAGSKRDPAKMSHSHPAGLLAAYNSLTDKHLAGYFNNTRIRRQLLRSGLITRNGRILSEKEYKLNIMKRDHQKYIRDCLAQAIFHKVLDMERYHQLEIKNKLETLAKKERVQRFKGEPTRRSIEHNISILSPHPPVGQKSKLGHTVLDEKGHSSPLTLTAPRPYTAPGNMQPPIRLQPLSSNRSAETVPKTSSGSRSKTSLLENEAPFPIGGKKAVMKFRNSMDNPQVTNRYQLPIINNYLMPIPLPPPPRDGKFTRENRTETWRRKRFRPTTVPNGLEPLFTRDSRRIHKASLHSNAAITMIYLGKSVHLSYDVSDFRDEIKVYQQHCGGENLCVYKGKLLEKETFQFISKRHHGFPFSLTFFLNGIQVNRLSSCCEYKHRKGSRLGGKRGYFGFVCVERSSPCYKCIIAMGLDKKTSSKTKKENAEKREELKKSEEKLRKDKQHMIITRRKEIQGGKTSAIFSAPEDAMGIREVRTAVEEMGRKQKPGQDIWEDDQENIFKYEYEEDFEADEEKQDEKANDKRQADDQMNGMSKSPSDDEKDKLDPEKEGETSSQKAPDAYDNVKDESDGYSESELEEDKQDRKTASSTSRSHPNSSYSEDNSSLEGRDAHTENSSEESARSSSSRELSENDEPGKSHLLIDKFLGIETQDQEIIKADKEIETVPTEENSDNVLKKKVEKRPQMIAEGISVKSKMQNSKTEKEKAESKLWERSPTKAKDGKAGPLGVEKEGGKDSLHLAAIVLLGAPNGNLVVKERAVIRLNKESMQVAPAMCTLEKKEAMEGDEVSQTRGADTIEKKGEAALWGDLEAEGVPFGEWKTITVTPTLAEEQFIVEREIPQDNVSGAGTAAEGDRHMGKENLNPTGKEADRDSASLNEEGASGEQDLMQTVPETDKAVSVGEQGSKNSTLRCRAGSLSSEYAEEAVTLREAAASLGKRKNEQGDAMSEEESERPDDTKNEQEVSTDLKNIEPLEEATSQKDNDSEEETLEEAEQTKEWKKVTGMETPLRFSVSVKAGVKQMSWEGSLVEGRKEDKKDVEWEKIGTETEFNREDDRKEMLSEELDATRERKKDEKPNPYLRETESEKEEVKRVDALKHEDALKDGNTFKEEEGETMKENRSEEETKAHTKEMVSDTEEEIPMKESELIKDTGLPREDSLKAREIAMFEALHGFGKPLEHRTAPSKEDGGERLTEVRETEHKGKAELLHTEKVTPSEDEGSQYEECVLRVPESELALKALVPEVTVTTRDEAEEFEAKTQDFLPYVEERDKEGSLQQHEGVGNMMMTQGDVSEGDSIMAGKFNEEAMREVMEEKKKEDGPGKGVMKNRSTEGVGNLTEGSVVAEADSNQGETAQVATEKREELADMEIAEGKTANRASSFSDVAGEEIWQRVEELIGKTSASERVGVEKIALLREEVPVVEDVKVTLIPDVGLGTLRKPSDLEEEVPQLGQDKEGKGEETTLLAGTMGMQEGMGSIDSGQESGISEALRLELPQQRGSELSRENLQAVNPDFTDTQEKQECTVQTKNETADVFLNHTKT